VGEFNSRQNTYMHMHTSIMNFITVTNNLVVKEVTLTSSYKVITCMYTHLYNIQCTNVYMQRDSEGTSPKQT